MTVPATTGQLRTKIEDMQIGDYIACNYTASNGAVGTFSNFGGTEGTEIPVTGSATPNGTFYFIMVAKSNNGGLLVADRVIQHSISWNTLNAAKVIQGRPQTFDGKEGIIRSLTGGVAYADANGNKSTSYQGYGGWPKNNEWDKYVVNFPKELIQSGKTLDDVFHWNGVGTWCQETAINGLLHTEDGSAVASGTERIFRGVAAGNTKFLAEHRSGAALSSTANSSFGFRPVFEYIES